MKMKTALAVMYAAFTMSAAFAVATVSETELELPTYPFSDPNPVPRTASNNYPYFFFDGTSAKSVSKRWKAVILENAKIKVTILPEIGGKIWGAVDKATGHEFIYFNHAVKFRNIARRGPWCSGGIEFNFGIIGHSPSTSTPVSYFCRTNADGSASYFCADTELICRTTWQVEVNLPPDADHFFTRTTWFNGSNFSTPYYQWMNAAYSVRGNPEFCFPGSAYIGHCGDSHLWPIDADGHDLSVYSGNAFGGPKSEHVLNGDNSIYGIWWPEKKIGSIHTNHATQKYGRKVWLWSLSRSGGIWEDLLTDEDGQYTELQSGRCFNQPADTHTTPFKHTAFAPGATDVFEEQWGVVRDKAVFDRAWNATNYVSRPQTMPEDFNWDTAYGHFIKGEQLIRRRMDADGEKDLLKCLEQEPYFVPALNLLASLAVRRGQYGEAHARAAAALSVDTYAPEANYADGQAFFAEGHLRAAKERLGLAAYSPQFRTAAFALVAKAEMREGNWDAADSMAKNSLLANGLNLDAWLARIAVARKRGDVSSAASLARQILERVPLFHAARYELNLADATTTPFGELVRCEFPHQVYLEMGGWYEEAGLDEDAERLFRLAATNPVGGLRLAALLNRNGRAGEASKVLDGVATKPIAFALPFRRETLPALVWAAENRPEWKFKYYAAVGLVANAWKERADRLLEACGDAPDDETFYLYRASRTKGEASLRDLRRAAALQNSWRTGYAIYQYFADGEEWEKACAEVEPYVARFPDANPIKLAYGMALARCGRHGKAISYLENLKVLPSENGDDAMSAWVLAWKGAALEALARGDRAEARRAVAKALSFPENLGRGKPYDMPRRGKPDKPGLLYDWPDSLWELIEWKR